MQLAQITHSNETEQRQHDVTIYLEFHSCHCFSVLMMMCTLCYVVLLVNFVQGSIYLCSIDLTALAARNSSFSAISVSNSAQGTRDIDSCV
jgi:hypothetical protein